MKAVTSIIPDNKKLLLKIACLNHKVSERKLIASFIDTLISFDANNCDKIEKTVLNRIVNQARKSKNSNEGIVSNAG